MKLKKSTSSLVLGLSVGIFAGILFDNAAMGFGIGVVLTWILQSKYFKEDKDAGKGW